MYKAHNRGQTSIEFLFITLLIVTVCVTIIAGFSQVNTSTSAIALLRSAALKELALEDSFYYVASIDGPEQWEGSYRVPLYIIRVGGSKPVDLVLKTTLAFKTQQALENSGLYEHAQVMVEQA